MNGLGLNSGLLAHALRRAAGRRSEEKPDAFRFENAQDRVEERRFAHPWATGHHGHLGPQDEVDSGTLGCG